MAVLESNIKYWRVVLRDIFLIPDQYLEINGIAPPTDIAEIVRLSGLTADQVHDRLSNLKTTLNPEVCVSWDDVEKFRTLCQISGGQFCLLDVRSSDDFKTGRLHGAVSIHEIDFSDWLRSFASSNGDNRHVVIVVGSDNEQSWSAALYLRDHGIRQSYALELNH